MTSPARARELPVLSGGRAAHDNGGPGQLSLLMGGNLTDSHGSFRGFSIACDDLATRPVRRGIAKANSAGSRQGSRRLDTAPGYERGGGRRLTVAGLGFLQNFAKRERGNFLARLNNFAAFASSLEREVEPLQAVDTRLLRPRDISKRLGSMNSQAGHSVEYAVRKGATFLTMHQFIEAGFS